MQKRPKTKLDSEEFDRQPELAEELNPEQATGDEWADMAETEAGDVPEGEPMDRDDSSEEKIAELNDRYLRLYSEFDNYRKRTIKERIDLSKTASAEVITSLLPVLDDFERAIKAFAGNGGADHALKEGIILIYNKFLNTLTQKGLEQMKTIGEPFDTDYHEAITNIPASSPELKGKVVDEIEKGYLLNGKVIRYAKVVVGS